MHETTDRVIVRPMTEEDLPQVETIEQESFSMPWSLDAFRSTIAREDTIYMVACEEDEIVGYCGMYVSFDEGEDSQCGGEVHQQKSGHRRKDAGRFAGMRGSQRGELCVPGSAGEQRGGQAAVREAGLPRGWHSEEFL